MNIALFDSPGIFLSPYLLSLPYSEKCGMMSALNGKVYTLFCHVCFKIKNLTKDLEEVGSIGYLNLIELATLIKISLC